MGEEEREVVKKEFLEFEISGGKSGKYFIFSHLKI